jgi:hypothetical protein
VLEPNDHLGRDRVRWEGVLFFFGLAAALAIASSCGSASTTVAPSITASCVPTQGTGADVTVLGTAQCTASVLNASSTLVNWSVSGTGNGSIDAKSGLYTAPATVPSTNVITITATSQVQSTLTATASLTIVAATAITAVICNDSTGSSPSPLVVSSMNSLSCTAFASVSTGTTVPVNWTITNTNNPSSVLNLGSISKQGVYTAPLVPPPGQMVTITATSQALATETMGVTATVVFGNAVLSGPYAFSTSGRLPTHAFWARVGSFSAGGGALVGTEDTNQGGTPNTVTTQRNFTGSYSIGPDGRGTMQFCEGSSAACPQGSPATAYFNIVVISPQQAQMIEFSQPVTPPPTTATAGSASTIAGGEMISQDQSVFSAGTGNLSGTYSFNFAGVSTTATEESVLGEFNANGHGTISPGSPTEPGEMDINPTPVSLPTSLAGTNYSFSSNGRGTVTLNNGTVNLTFSIYPVSANRAKFIEIDTATVATPTVPASILVGDAYIQQTSSNCGWALNALSGSTVFETSGLNSLGGPPGVVIGDIGNFTADGTTGAVSAASIDENSGGAVSSTVGTLTGNYTVDSCGRGTLTIGGHSYVFYIISPSDAVLQETTTGIIAHGFFLPSVGGPFVDGTLKGSYGFRLGGTDAAGTAGNREDLVGQVTSGGLGTGLAGTLDLNDFGATQTPVAIANGTYLPAPAGSLRATMALPLATISGNTTRNLVLYMVSPTLFYVLDTDPAPAGATIGVINNQF